LTSSRTGHHCEARPRVASFVEASLVHTQKAFDTRHHPGSHQDEHPMQALSLERLATASGCKSLSTSRIRRSQSTSPTSMRRLALVRHRELQEARPYGSRLLVADEPSDLLATRRSSCRVCAALDEPWTAPVRTMSSEYIRRVFLSMPRPNVA